MGTTGTGTPAEDYSPIPLATRNEIAIAGFVVGEAGGVPVRPYVGRIAIARVFPGDGTANKLTELTLQARAVNGRAYYTGKYAVANSVLARARSEWDFFKAENPPPSGERTLLGRQLLVHGVPRGAATRAVFGLGSDEPLRVLEQVPLSVATTLFYLQDDLNGGVGEPGPRAMIECDMFSAREPVVRVSFEAQAPLQE